MNDFYTERPQRNVLISQNLCSLTNTRFLELASLVKRSLLKQFQEDEYIKLQDIDISGICLVFFCQ